jgi:hypothetical protein
MTRNQPPRRQERQAIGGNDKTDRKSACHFIRQSSNPTNFPRFPCFPWTKNGFSCLKLYASGKAFSVEACRQNIDHSMQKLIMLALCYKR